jgi:hypothetical protein
VGWTTLLVEGLGAFAVVVVAVFILVFWSLIRNYRLAPPRVRGLSSGQQPRYLEILSQPARRRFEELGFREAGYLATKPMMESEPEVVQLVMRSDETRTVAYLYARRPFNEARPCVVSFESFLRGGSVFATSGRLVSTIGPPLPNRRRSLLDDDRDVYRDHLAALAESGLAAADLPADFEGLVALNVADVAWIWRTRLEQRVVVAALDGGFRYAKWPSLASIPRVLFEQLRSAIVEASRRQSGRELGPVIDTHAPEIRQFIDDCARRKKEASEATAHGFKMSRGHTATLWVALVIGFTIFWRYLSH